MAQRRIGWLLVGVQFALLITIVLMPHRPPGPASIAAGVLISASGLGLGLWSSRRLGSALTPTPVPIARAGLRTDGPYSRVRHPIYASLILMAAGFAVAVGTIATFVAVVALVGLLWGKSRWEDRLLRIEYGAEWEDWAQRTGAMMPLFRQGRNPR